MNCPMSIGSTCDVSRRSAITRAAMQSLENPIWRSRRAISTKLKLYNTCILPIFLYGSDCWAISKTDTRTRPVVSAYAAWHQMVPIYTERWRRDSNEATQTHCYNPVAPAYFICAYAHGRQCRCQEDPVSLPSSRLEKTARSSPHYVALHHPTGSETTPTTLRSTKQQIWLRTALCRGWCRRMVLWQS